MIPRTLSMLMKFRMECVENMEIGKYGNRHHFEGDPHVLSTLNIEHVFA